MYKRQRIHRHHLYDPASAEQALRAALEQPAGDEATGQALREASAELVTCLEMQGRGAEATAQGEALAEPGAAVLADREEPGAAVLADREEPGASGAIAGLMPALSQALGGIVRGGSSAQIGELLAMLAALARLLDGREPTADIRAWLQLAAFLAPQGAIAGSPGSLEVTEQDPESIGESREALRAALRSMAGETAGIRAPGAASAGPWSPEAADAVVLAEVELGPMRAALGLALPVTADGYPGEGGVGVRNERPPALGVGAALAGLSAAERRFRLAFAAAMIADGLAIVTDPQGASLPELLAALHHLADRTCPLRLPGAQAIVRALAARGFTGEQLPPASREALAREVSGWQQSRASVARLAQLLRRDSLRLALRLSGALDGALRTLGRDARVSGASDGTLQVLASADGRCLLRAAGLIP